MGKLGLLANRCLGRYGFELRRKQLDRSTMAACLRRMRGTGFSPGLIIDVGAATGTLEIYDAFPGVSLVLIEPLREFERDLRRVCEKRSGRYIIAAASDSNGSTTIHVHDHDLFGSSFYREVEGAAVDGTERQVSTVRLDDVIGPECGSLLTKIDVQGAELTVLDGATNTLQRSEIVILESLLYDTLIGAPQFEDRLSYMKKSGFVVYDICDLLYRPLDGALSQVDLIFVREHGPFRQHHAYATPEQREGILREEHRALSS
jgi:FkbM family methyltransferase